MRIFVAIVGIAAVCMTVVAGCKKIEPDVIIDDRTNLPEEDPNLQTVIIKGDTLLLVYTPGSAKPSYRSGDFVVGETGEGYLKKVLSTSERGDTLVLVTSQASLTDVVKKGSIDTSLTLVPDSLLLQSINLDTVLEGKDGGRIRMAVRSGPPRVLPMGDGLTFEIRLPNVELIIRDGNNNPAVTIKIDTIVLEKGIDLNLAVQVEDGEITLFRAVAQSTEELGLRGVDINLEGSVFAEDAHAKLALIPLGFAVVMVGPIPVVFVFEAGIYLGVGADLTVTVGSIISNEVSLSSSNTVGAEFSEGAWHPVREKVLEGNADFTFAPSASVEASLTGYVKGSLDIKLYGIVGPSLYVSPYQYNEASYPPFDYELGIGIMAGLGFKVEILNWSLVEYNHTFADYRKMLLHATNNPPDTPDPPDGPTSGEVGVSYEFTASTTDPDGDRVQYRFAWGDGNTSEWTSLVNSGRPGSKFHSWSSSDTFDIKAQARDEHGATSGWSGTHSITITGGGQPGTMRWKYVLDDSLRVEESSAAIGADGTIYVESNEAGYLYAINPDGTFKWKHLVLCPDNAPP